MINFFITVIFSIVLAVYINRMFLENDDNVLTKRINRILNKNKVESTATTNSQKYASKLRKQQVDDKTKKSIDSLKKFGLIKPEIIKEKLQQAGLRKPSHLLIFVIVKIAAPIVMPLLLLTYSNFFAQAPLTGFKLWGGLALTFVGGFYAADSVLADKVKKRLNAIDATYPEALDMLLISVEAGSAIEGAIDKVVDEMSKTAPEIAEEFGMLLAEISFLPDRADAFRNLAKRVPLDDIKPFVVSLVQSDQTGSSLAPALRVIAAENRRSRLMRAEKKAATLPAKLTVPLVLFIFPSLFVVILGPVAVDYIMNGTGL